MTLDLLSIFFGMSYFNMVENMQVKCIVPLFCSEFLKWRCSISVQFSCFSLVLMMWRNFLFDAFRLNIDRETDEIYISTMPFWCRTYCLFPVAKNSFYVGTYYFLTFTSYFTFICACDSPIDFYNIIVSPFFSSEREVFI